MSDGSPIVKTAFVVMWDKAISNMGIEVNWKDMEYMQGQLETAFSDISEKYYAAICDKPKEDGSHGYHVHLVISFDKAKRISSIAKMLGCAHTEMMRGTKEEASAYIEKEGKYAEKGETVLRKFGNKSAITNNRGKSLDLGPFYEYMKQGLINASNIDKIALQMGQTPYQVQEIRDTFMNILLADYTEVKYRDVKVFYIEGKTGTGKTYIATQSEEYEDYFRVSCSQKTSFPFNGYKGQKTLILDELRPGIFSPGELFQILDKYPYYVDVKHGRFPALWNTVLITTAFPLEKWFADPKETTGQDNNHDQFRRRIDEHLTAIVDEWVIDTHGNRRASKSHWEPFEKVKPKTADEWKHQKEKEQFKQMSLADIKNCPFN